MHDPAEFRDLVRNRAVVRSDLGIPFVALDVRVESDEPRREGEGFVLVELVRDGKRCVVGDAALLEKADDDNARLAGAGWVVGEIGDERHACLRVRERRDTSTTPFGASPSSLRTWSIAACPTPFSESARMKASLMARTSVCEIDLPFHPVKMTWLLSFPRVVSLVSLTSPALYVPDDIF